MKAADVQLAQLVRVYQPKKQMKIFRQGEREIRQFCEPKLLKNLQPPENLNIDLTNSQDPKVNGHSDNIQASPIEISIGDAMVL